MGRVGAVEKERLHVPLALQEFDLRAIEPIRRDFFARQPDEMKDQRLVRRVEGNADRGPVLHAILGSDLAGFVVVGAARFDVHLLVDQTDTKYLHCRHRPPIAATGPTGFTQEGVSATLKGDGGRGWDLPRSREGSRSS